MRNMYYLCEAHQSQKKKRVIHEKLAKKGQKIFNICLIDIYVSNCFVGFRELIPTYKSYKYQLKNCGNSPTYVQQIYLLIMV